MAKRSKSAAAARKVRAMPARGRTGSAFNAITRVPSLGPLGFPKRLNASLRTVSEFTIAYTGGVSGTQIFSANGMYDPDITGTGSQPYYFDQLMAVYDHYTVVRSKCSFQVLGYTSSSSLPVQMHLHVNDDGSAAASGVEMEQSTTSLKGMNLQSGPVTVNNNWSSKAFFGPGATSDPNMRGTDAANPAEVSSFVCRVRSPTVDTVTAYCRATIDYTAIFHELSDTSGS